jgi:hypothetical protein
MMNAAPRRLPIDTVVKRSFLYAWESRAILMAPLLIYAGITAFADLAAVEVFGSDNRAALFLVTIAEQIFGMAFAVGIHRFVLLAEAPANFRFFRWDRNFVQYVVVALLLLVIGVSALLMAAGALGDDPTAQPPGVNGVAALFSLFVMIFAALVLSRFSLALPATALGDPVRPRQVWQATAGNGFRLLATAMLVVLPFFVADGAFYIQLIAVGGVAKVVFIVLLRLVASAELVVMTIMLSLSYDVLVRGQGPTAR